MEDALCQNMLLVMTQSFYQDYQAPHHSHLAKQFFHNIMHNIYARFKKYMILVHHHHHCFLPSKESIKIPNKFTDVSYKLLDPYAKLNYIKKYENILHYPKQEKHTHPYKG